MQLRKMTGARDFSCVGGLEKHIRIVKEMVLFPLMYGDVYAKFNLRPPRGLLFYGPPGTGKTLVASALAAECNNSERKVSFISRKGSDCLSKWVGESEQKLQKIFQLAQQSKPCIIFFDEVDGLAPVRSNRQDFVHASIVSTLLALMDGLDNNSEIIVIGATNRLDAIDPALRRPGRFDRELYFPLPCYTARKDILSIHVKSWKQKPPQKFLAYLATKTVGFCGSDLQALCTEAVMCCVRRNYPQIYTTKSKHHINERTHQVICSCSNLIVEKLDFIKAQQNIVPASHRICITPVKTLPSELRPLLQDKLTLIMSSLHSICPAEMISHSDLGDPTASHSMNCPRILLCGTDDCHTRHLAPAVLHALEHLPCHVLDVTTLFEETGRTVEESIIQKVKAARHTLPSLLYVPDLLSWWDLVDEISRVVFTSLIRGLDHSVHVLVLITAKCDRHNLPTEILELFNEHQKEIFEIGAPNEKERERYFYEVFLRTNSNWDSISDKSYNAAATARTLSAPTLQSNTRSSSSSNSNSNSNNSKRKHITSGVVESPPTKRQRLAAGATNCAAGSPLNASRSAERLLLTEAQMQDLLCRAVSLTDSWPCQQLESLRVALECSTEDPAQKSSDAYASLLHCLANFDNDIVRRYDPFQPSHSL